MLLPGLVLPPERPVIPVSELCSLAEARVYKALAWGSANARRIDELAADAGLDSRTFQAVVDHLALKHHAPVGSSMRPPFGNYLIESVEDLEHTVLLFRRRGLRSLARSAALKRQALRAELGYLQFNLDLFGEDLG